MLIATYIKEDLAAHLRAGQDLPTQLTLHSLADHYRVSLTPVRVAVAELIDEGLLQKQPNRRLTVSGQQNGRQRRKQRPHLPHPPRDPFEMIANDLVKLSLDGRPVFLREVATAETYGISRSAVRNILHRLAGSGILDHIPRRGWRLRPFRQEDMQAFLEVRELLELKALDLARPHLVGDDLQSLLDGNTLPASNDDPPRIDNSLHAYIIDKAGNGYIKEFLQRHSRYFDVLFDWEDQDRETAIETIRQHREILEALLEKDWRGARKALSYHIRCNHPILSKILPRGGERGTKDDGTRG